MRWHPPSSLDLIARSFVATGAVAALVQTLSWYGCLPAIRIVAFALATAAILVLTRSLLAARSGTTIDLPWPDPDRLSRWLGLILLVTFGALFLSALGPPTDADSLDYHLGAPLEWLRRGGAGLSGRTDWMDLRLAGAGEALNLLGLASGTDRLGALLQVGALAALVAVVTSFGRTDRDRLLGAAFVLTMPLLLFLVPSQKAQLLPAAATTVALAIVVTRFETLGTKDMALAFGCCAFAVACKPSFLLTGSVVSALGLVAAWRAGRLARALLVGSASFVVLTLPFWAAKFSLYGDPLSPFLERWRTPSDPVVVAFASVLTAEGGRPTPSGLLHLAQWLVVPPSPGALASVLGLGVFAAFTIRQDTVSKRIVLAAATATLLLAAFSQLAPRFFLEPYLWCAMAATAAPWSRSKSFLRAALLAQGTLTAGMAVYSAALLFPGALTPHLRERVMDKAAYGYAESRWLDAAAPRDAVILSRMRSHALMPRPFAVPDRVLLSSDDDARFAVFRSLVLEQGVTHLVVELPKDETLGASCGDLSITKPARLREATRNPFNRGRDYRVGLLRVERSPAALRMAFDCFMGGSTRGSGPSR